MIQLRFLKTALLLSSVLCAVPVQAGDGFDSLTESDCVGASYKAKAVVSDECDLIDDADDDTYHVGNGMWLTNPFHGSRLRFVVEEPPFSPSDFTEQDREEYDHEINKPNRCAKARVLEGVLREQSALTGVAIKSQNSEQFDSLSDWGGVIVSSHIVKASGQQVPLVSKEAADALYAKNVTAYNRKPSVLVRQTFSTAAPYAKNMGTACVDLIGVPAAKAAIAQKIAEGTATYIIDATGKIITYGIGACVGHAPAAAFYATWWGFNHGMSYVPLGSTMKELIVGQTVIKPLLAPALSVTKAVAQRLPSVVKSVGSVFSSAYSWIKGWRSQEAAPAA